MKEDNKPSNIACTSFVPHRSKATQCGRCFKSHAQHKQFMKGNKNDHNSFIMELCANQDIPESFADEERPSHNKMSPMSNDKVSKIGRNSLLADDESGGITTDYFTPDLVMKTGDLKQPFNDTDSRPRRQIPKKSAARRTREAGFRRSPHEISLKLNIPLDQIPLNNFSLASDVNKNKESNGFDSVSDNGSENSNTELWKVLRNSKNGSVNEDEKVMNPRDSAGMQYLKAIRASHKSSIPIPKTITEQNSGSEKLQEFQEVARNLRHVSNPNLDLNEMNGNHCQAVRNHPVTNSDVSPKLNRREIEERQRTTEAKSSQELSDAAFQTFSGQSKHDTLPRNLGTAVFRPSIVNASRHQRQSSDPEVFQPAEKEEIQVVSISTAETLSSQDLFPKRQVVTTSKISSEIFFGASSSNSKQQSPKQIDNSHDIIKAFLDHTEKPVMIVAADGSIISHYKGSADAPAESSDLESGQQGKRHSYPKHLAKPYKVVDVSRKPPENPPDFQMPVGPRLPLSPSPRYKSSDGESNASVDSGQDSALNVFRFQGSRFPKRDVALLDGMYAMKDSVRISQQGSGVTDSKDLKSPLSDADGDTTPTFPILLSESESESSDKRRLSNSSNYKVPIFISPKNYDNVGTVLSDMESSTSDLSKDIPGTSVEVSYGYLTPMRPIKEVKQVDEEPPPVPVRTSSETRLHLPETEEKLATPTAQSKQKVHSKKPRRFQGQEPNSNNSQSSPDSHWRSKTHPLGLEPIYAKVNTETKKSNVPVTRSNTDVGKTKQKRIAPLPPNEECQEAVYVLPDSLPRGLPPPPPGKEKRWSFGMDNSQASPGKPVKPAAPSPPTEGQLGVIYEAMDRKPTPTKTAPNAATSSLSKPQAVPSSGRVQSTPKERSAAAPNTAQFPPGKHLQTGKERMQSLNQKLKTNTESKGGNSPPNAAEVAPILSPSRPVSPPIPCSRLEVIQLPDSSPYQSPNSKETKPKRSKLPWRRRRKKDGQGSPERDFDATAVKKWLMENVHQLQLEEDVQRNSMDRLEVINAYRGERTAFIDHSDLQSPSPSTSPEQNDNDSDGSGIRMRASSSSKRRAPEPPASGRPASWVVGTRVSSDGSTEDIPQLHKSQSQSKRRASDGDTLVQYENTGVLGQRQKKSAPPKPERRQRSRTTGFENLLSHEESDVKPPVLKRQSSSDPDFTTTVCELLPGAQPIIPATAPTLKSALKTPGSFETKKAEWDAQAQPKRPVRIIAPQKTLEKEPSFVNIYSNIEIVQRGLGTADAKAFSSSVVFTADAETQCAWTLPTGTTEMASGSATEDSGICESILDINKMALARLAVAAPGQSGLYWGEPDMTRLWGDNQQLEDQPCCTVPGGAFYKVAHPEQKTSVFAVMIGTDAKQASDLLNIAQCSRMVSSHPNILNICHASIESVPRHLLQSNWSEPKASAKETSQAEERVETTVVVTDRVPVTHVGNYVSHNKELHEYLPEKYEHDVALLLLQLLRGLHHLQMHRVCPRSLKPDDLLLVDSGLPGGGSSLLINIVMSHLQRDHAKPDSPGDIYGSPDQLDEKIAEFDVGLLVYKLLHQTNPFVIKTSLIVQEYEPEHLPPIPTRSRYSPGLCRLAGELLRKKPSDRLGASQAIGMLQCLLWGPPANHMQQAGSLSQALQRWLATEQARKVVSMCEYCIPGSDEKATGYSLADQLQCQFLSDVSIQTLLESMKLLHQ